MKYYFLFFIFYFVLILSCDEGSGPDTDPPLAPQFADKTVFSDMSEFEVMSIDAVAGPENSIRLIWKGHPERSRLRHFTVYRSEEPQGLINFFPYAQVDPGGEFIGDSIYHTFTDAIDIDERKPYYYYVTAINEEGEESSPSDTVWYELISKASLSNPLGIRFDLPEYIDFQWTFNFRTYPSAYILRIEEDFSYSLVFVEMVELTDYSDPQRTHRLSADILKNFILDEIQYRWRIDCVQQDTVHYGSESNWGTFQVNWGE
jgi:hypothetical protein